jgi:hypothetical protein
MTPSCRDFLFCQDLERRSTIPQNCPSFCLAEGLHSGVLLLSRAKKGFEKECPVPESADKIVF